MSFFDIAGLVVSVVPLISEGFQRALPILRPFGTIICSAYINVLLVILPFAIISRLLGWPSAVVFTTNFFALMPLTSLLNFATEELSKRVGPMIGGLINATFANPTELIMGIIALKRGQVRLIQT